MIPREIKIEKGIDYFDVKKISDYFYKITANDTIEAVKIIPTCDEVGYITVYVAEDSEGCMGYGSTPEDAINDLIESRWKKLWKE